MLKTRRLWNKLSVAPDESHHLFESHPAYSKRYLQVLKFHAPGFAPVKDETGAFHIDVWGNSIYSERYLRTFGYYHLRAAVHSKDGWFHITTRGKPLYSQRYAWVGNFQEKLCAVRDSHGAYFHLNHQGEKAYLEGFQFVGDFKDGYAVAQNVHGLSTHINREGEYLHGRWFVDLDIFHKGFARAKDSDGWFHIDKTGNAAYIERYANIEPYYNGFARVELPDLSIALINETGVVVQVIRKPQRDPFHIASSELVSYWRLYTLYCAHDLKIFELLPSSDKEISQHLQFPIESVKRLLRALHEMGLVTKLTEDIYSPTEIGAHFSSKHQHSLTKALQFWREEHRASWDDLYYSLQTGNSAFENKHAMTWFSWLRKDKNKNEFFHEVMQTYACRDYQKTSKLLPMEKHKVVLDVGGSTGSLLAQVMKDYPHLSGILLDLPEIIDQNRLKNSENTQITFVGKDFFELWPPLKADAIFLSRVLHDWPDLEAITILKKAQSCLEDSSTSRIYILENLLDPSTGKGALLDLNMLVMTKGKERTLNEYEELLAAADLKVEELIPLNEVTFILAVK